MKWRVNGILAFILVGTLVFSNIAYASANDAGNDSEMFQTAPAEREVPETEPTEEEPMAEPTEEEPMAEPTEEEPMAEPTEEEPVAEPTEEEPVTEFAENLMLESVLYAEAEMQVSQKKALTVEVNADKEEVKPGEKITYTIKVTNPNEEGVNRIRIHAPLNDNAVYPDTYGYFEEKYEWSGEVSDRTAEVLYDEGSLGRYRLSGKDKDTYLGPGQYIELTITGTLKDETVVKEGTEIVFGVYANHGIDNERVVTERVEETVKVAEKEKPLTVEVSADKKEVKPGDQITYTVRVTNPNKKPVNRVRIHAPLNDQQKYPNTYGYFLEEYEWFGERSEEGAEVVRDEDAPGRYRLNGKDKDTYLGPGEWIKLTITGTLSDETVVKEGTEIPFAVYANHGTTDKVTSDPQGFTVKVAEKEKPLTVEVSADKREVKPGDQITYTVRVTNPNKKPVNRVRIHAPLNDQQKYPDTYGYFLEEYEWFGERSEEGAQVVRDEGAPGRYRLNGKDKDTYLGPGEWIKLTITGTLSDETVVKEGTEIPFAVYANHGTTDKVTSDPQVFTVRVPVQEQAVPVPTTPTATGTPTSSGSSGTSESSTLPVSVSPEIPAIPEIPAAPAIPVPQAEVNTPVVPEADNSLMAIGEEEVPLGGYALDEVETEDNGLVEIADEDTPLAGALPIQEDVQRCFIHFLLLLMAVVLTVYNLYDKKKQQGHIASLNEELEKFY